MEMVGGEHTALLGVVVAVAGSGSKSCGQWAGLVVSTAYFARWVDGEAWVDVLVVGFGAAAGVKRSAMRLWRCGWL